MCARRLLGSLMSLVVAATACAATESTATTTTTTTTTTSAPPPVSFPGSPSSAAEAFEQMEGLFAVLVIRPETAGLTPGSIGTDPTPFLSAVDEERLRDHVEAVAEPRGPEAPESLEDVVGYVTAQFEDLGYDVGAGEVSVGESTSTNLSADLVGDECPDRIFVVGAHLDSVDDSPGADDNASGIAATLEMARVLADDPLPMTVRFAGFAFEEEARAGSEQMVGWLTRNEAEVIGMLNLDMIGYTASEVDEFIGLPGEYLAMVVDQRSEYLGRVFGVASFTFLPDFWAAAAKIDPEFLPDIARSDHASFWEGGYPAIFFTDTGELRNENYHSPDDTADTLDYDFMANSTRAALAGLVALGTIDADGDGTPDACSRRLG